MAHGSIWMDLMGVAFEQGWLEAGGIRTRYLHAGDKSKPALFLLHGTGGHSEAYSRNLAAHGQYFSTWAYDMVGNGLSDKPAVDLEIPVYVEHLKDVMDRLGVAKASLSGESLGGWVAARFAIKYPERVDRIVLNTTGGNTAFPQVMERIRTLSMASVEDPSWERIKSRLEFLMADKSKVNDDLVAVRQRIYSAPGMVEAMRRTLCLQDMEIRRRNMLSAEEWGAIKAPTLVLWTSHDPTADVSEGRKISELIPGAKFVVMDGCGHWPQFEDAETFNRIHLDFLLGRG
jgi:2-hydroxy-6-oxonona-2,4-dienedioate hydrolase